MQTLGDTSNVSEKEFFHIRNWYVGEGEDVIQNQRFLQRFLCVYALNLSFLLLVMANTET